jgi:hypothetical protein
MPLKSVAHAFEAYLNYVGVKLDSTLWKKEREFFRKAPYRGCDGKLRKVFEMVELVEPDRDVGPYSTIMSLKKLRDTIAHGHVIPINRTIPHTEDAFAPVTSWVFDLQVSHQLASEAMADVGQVASMIHAAAMSKTNDPWFADVPFGGAHFWTSHMTQAT